MKTIVDYFNMLFIAFNVSRSHAMKEKGSFTEEDVGLYYHKILDAVIGYSREYGQLIFADEGKGSLEWRRSIYPEYKANRKHDDTYQIFRDHLNDVNELISYFPTKKIAVDGAEADDVMYALATHFADESEDVLVITGDRDIAQLVNYSDKIKVYSPTLKIFRDKQPNLILEKAIVGDPSDNIPGIPRVGMKTFEKALSDRSVWDAKIQPNIAVVQKFLKIVDLSKAPASIKEEAVLQYKSKDFNEFSPQSIELFMYSNGLNEHLTKWPNDLSEINMALYKNGLTETKSEKEIKETELSDIESMLDLINSL